MHGVGAPRIPVLSVQGGDNNQEKPGQHNPRIQWSNDTLVKIEEGTLKRIAYWEWNQDTNNDTENTDMDNNFGKTI